MEMEHLKIAGFSELPTKPGVYFFYDLKDQLVYIGKSINIKQRVKQHFSGKDRKSIKIQTHVKRIAFEVMGSELIALLHESDLIKIHQPLYNRSLRKTVFQYGLYKTLVNGYEALRIEKISIGKDEITSFTTSKEAKQALFRITEKYNLCQKINGLYKTSGSCFQYQVKICKGACLGKEDPLIYNQRVEQFLTKTTIEKFTQLFILEGRNETEYGLVHIENGVYRGFGFYPKKSRANKLKSIMPKQDNKDIRRILIRYLISN